MKKIVIALMFLSTTAFAADAPPVVSMTRAEVNAAFNAIAAIGQYKLTAKQGGQDVIVDKYLDVAGPMRSTLVHDTTVLRAVAIETAKLQDDAKARIEHDEKYKTDAERVTALNIELSAMLQEKIEVPGLITFSESDLQFDKNPHITPILGSALAPLEK